MKKPRELQDEVEAAVAEICAAAYSDTFVQLDRRVLAANLLYDYEHNGSALPSREECTILVMGGDDGEVPAALAKKFQWTNTFLEEQLT